MTVRKGWNFETNWHRLGCEIFDNLRSRSTIVTYQTCYGDETARAYHASAAGLRPTMWLRFARLVKFAPIGSPTTQDCRVLHDALLDAGHIKEASRLNWVACATEDHYKSEIAEIKRLAEINAQTKERETNAHLLRCKRRQIRKILADEIALREKGTRNYLCTIAVAEATYPVSIRAAIAARGIAIPHGELETLPCYNNPARHKVFLRQYSLVDEFGRSPDDLRKILASKSRIPDEILMQYN